VREIRNVRGAIGGGVIGTGRIDTGFDFAAVLADIEKLDGSSPPVAPG